MQRLTAALVSLSAAALMLAPQLMASPEVSLVGPAPDFEQITVTDGNLDVMLSNQVTPPVIVYLNQVDCNTTIVSNFSIGDYTVEIADATGADVGDYIGIFNTNGARYYAGSVLAVDGTTITTDTPSDFDFVVGDVFQCGTKEMNVDGSLTNQLFSLRADPSLAFTVDITRIVIHITDQTAMDDARFGGILALTRGIVLRRKDGIYQNIFNVKTNGEFGELAFDKVYDDKAPAGFYGFSCRLTFAGQSKMGVAIRLGPDDDLQLIVQDDLTGLDSFRIIAEGHIVSD